MFIYIDEKYSYRSFFCNQETIIMLYGYKGATLKNYMRWLCCENLSCTWAMVFMVWMREKGMVES